MGLGKWSALKESLPGRIFISYRRQETGWPARHLYDVLVEHFPAEQVFKDVDNIEPGEDFVERITAAVESCDVLLPLIGPQWLTITDENGQRRLDNPEDYVRLEIETALTHKIGVIPILVDEAQMPRPNELPPTLAPLTRLNAIGISPNRFDTEGLIDAVQRAADYHTGLRLMHAGQWQGAFEAFERVTKSDPEYQDALKQLERARLELSQADYWEQVRAASGPEGRVPDDAHYKMAADRILAGDVVLFLGEGVNLFVRPASASWQVGRYLPSRSELAAYLASRSHYPNEDHTDLPRISEFIKVMLGPRHLYEWLHAVFDADYVPTPVHRWLASLPSLIRARRSDELAFFPLIVTTNYDDLLETAFKEKDEEYDLVTYVADGSGSGRFRHTSPDGEERLIDRPKTYKGLRFDERPVIAKIQGTVARGMPSHDSYIIGEGHYIDYLDQGDIRGFLPFNLGSRISHSNFLFLGCGTQDRNLLIFMRRFWGNAARWNSWSIQPNPNAIEERWWTRSGVEVFDVGLAKYIHLLDAALRTSNRT
jgi:SIR2-like domain/TIR domain